MNLINLDVADEPSADSFVSAPFVPRRTQPRRAGEGDLAAGYVAADAIVQRHGEDSLAPFLVRPDKALHFAARGVLAYRLIGNTAVISADPIAPRGNAPAVLASFLESARAAGWRIAMWGASGHHLESYRELGLRALPIGEEAFVDPAGFTLEGRRVRKLRQSVHRVGRRGWQLSALDGLQLDHSLEREIAAVEERWRSGRSRILGFAMSMGAFSPPRRTEDLYLLARAPCGELRAVMRFAGYCGNLSLDSMRRVGETPNGLNEALVCLALEVARERSVSEVSLNYAGLAHLIRDEALTGRRARLRRRLLLALFGRQFQLERLVRFNEKFTPEWRPRYLVYESRLSLPRAAIRVLQAEGYLREPRSSRGGQQPRRLTRISGSPSTQAAG